MIFVDSNVFVIDLRYRDDRAYRDNRRFLNRLREEGSGVTSLLNVLEVCGILSFNLSPRSLRELFAYFGRRYGVLVQPALDEEARLPAPAAGEVLGKMEQRMSCKDAEIALAVEALPGVRAFVSWNAKHFAGRVACRVLTPPQWLRSD